MLVLLRRNSNINNTNISLTRGHRYRNMTNQGRGWHKSLLATRVTAAAQEQSLSTATSLNTQTKKAKRSGRDQHMTPWAWLEFCQPTGARGRNYFFSLPGRAQTCQALLDQSTEKSIEKIRQVRPGVVETEMRQFCGGQQKSRSHQISYMMRIPCKRALSTQ